MSTLYGSLTGNKKNIFQPSTYTGIPASLTFGSDFAESRAHIISKCLYTKLCTMLLLSLNDIAMDLDTVSHRSLH